MSTSAPGNRPGTEEVRLSREMSGFSVTMIGVGAMIGAGIFVLTGIAAGVAGPGLLLAFGLNGIVTLFTAMAYAELGSCFHDAGGGYLWVKEGLPQPNGFLSGWMSWFAHAVACSLYALGFGAYFGHVLEGFGVHVPRSPTSPSRRRWRWRPASSSPTSTSGAPPRPARSGTSSRWRRS